jgi:hypothetical protein
VETVLGPVRCHDCHLPTLVWADGRWWDRQWKMVRIGKGEFRAEPVLVEHRCTARPGQPMYEFTR